MNTINKTLRNKSYRLRIYGLILVIIASILTILYITTDLSLETKVFAINSSFFESNWFTIVQTNIVEEIMMILYILGLSLISWSVYKCTDKSKYYLLIRPAIHTFWIVTTIQILAILFFFGFGFVSFLIYNLIAYQTFFLFFYFIFKIKDKREFKNKKQTNYE